MNSWGPGQNVGEHFLKDQTKGCISDFVPFHVMLSLCFFLFSFFFFFSIIVVESVQQLVTQEEIYPLK